MNYQETFQHSNQGSEFAILEKNRLYSDSSNTQLSTESNKPVSNEITNYSSVNNFSHIFKSKVNVSDKSAGQKRNTLLMVPDDNASELPNKRIEVLQNYDLKRSMSFTDSMQFNTDLPVFANAVSQVDNSKLNRLQTDFEVISTIGSGVFGKVFKVQSKIDNAPYAVKVSRSSFRGANERKSMMNEVRISRLMAIDYFVSIHIYAL